MSRPRPWAVRQVAPPARLLLWSALRALGTDVTSASAGRSCMVLAAHPDDETLGCAVTIMRKREAGTRVVLVIAADGRASSRSAAVTPEQLAAIRSAETQAAATIMGIDATDLIRLGFEDAKLQDAESSLGRLLAELVDRHRPDEVLVTSVGDPHPDHAALGRAARQALAAAGGHGTRLLEYPIWQWRSPRSWLGPVSRPELVSTAGYLDRKREVLAAYRSQVSNLTGEPGWWSLDERLLVNFFRSHELFLPVRRR